MKAICKVSIPLFLAVFLAACSDLPQDSIATAAVDTALVEVRTALAETQAALPTNTPAPSLVPTFALPVFTATPAVTNPDGLVHPPPADRLDYAMAVAPKIYTLLPFISEADLLYGEYSGCTETADFNNFVAYGIPRPLETVTTAFVKYFKAENWEFTEPTSELIGYEQNIPRISYEVYRISSKGTPAFERLRVFLTDESLARGKDYIDVRVELTHIETKKNFMYFYCGTGKSWLWIRLHK